MINKIPKYRFNIVHHLGEPNVATTPDGVKVHRKKSVWIDSINGERGRFVTCVPYDNHFVFIDPNWKKIPDRWFAFCTCGGPAVIVGSNAYKKDGSPATDSTIKGEMLICYIHSNSGHHADGST